MTGPDHIDGPTSSGNAWAQVTWHDAGGHPTTVTSAVTGRLTEHAPDGTVQLEVPAVTHLPGSPSPSRSIHPAHEADSLDRLADIGGWPALPAQRARALADFIADPAWAGVAPLVKAQALGCLTRRISPLEQLVRATRNTPMDPRVDLLTAFPYQSAPRPTAAPNDPAWLAQTTAYEDQPNAISELSLLSAAGLLPRAVRDAVMDALANR